METEGQKSAASKLQVFFFPFLAQGHMIPMIEMAKLFAKRGVKSTLITTPYYKPSIMKSIEKALLLGFDLDIITMELPLKEVGLPDDCQSFHSVTSTEMHQKLSMAIRMLDKQFEKLIEEYRPNCVISDMFLSWTTDVAAKFGVPRIVFHGSSHFAMGAMECVRRYRPHANVSSDSEPFLIPNFPGEITMTRARLPEFSREETPLTKIHHEMLDSETKSFGIIMNSFYELEPDYAEYYRDGLGRRTWIVGPLLLCNRDIEEKSQGDNGTTDDKEDCLKWLDSKEPNSVVYICFGSNTDFNFSQLHELAKGLEASGQQFVWVVKKDHHNVGEGKEEWLPISYEERLQGKGLIIRGWAPQVQILNHKAVSGFVTHCGWNSTLESICAGVPMVTWPVAAEQFYNEKLITEVLRIGVPVGAQKWNRLVGDYVESEKVAKAVRRVAVGDEAKQMRMKARELSQMAKRAVEKGGSSHNGLTALLDELKLKS